MRRFRFRGKLGDLGAQQFPLPKKRPLQER
jgi:hypothetical protein